MRHTNRATITVTDIVATPEYSAIGTKVTQANRKTKVSPASKMLSAISLGVFCRSAPSTKAIMRSRNDSPGLAVMRTTMRSDNTFVPPVTAERSPPLSRITGADSPVIADSSTEAMPSITSPSPGIISPASTTTISPLRSDRAGILSSRFPLVRRRAVVSLTHLAQERGLGFAPSLRRPPRRSWRTRP